MIILGLVCSCEQNVLRTFTATDHKQPSLKSFKCVYKLNPVVFLLLVGLTDQPAQPGYQPTLAWLIDCNNQNE